MKVNSALIEHALTHARQVLDFYSTLPVPFQEKTPDALLKICREYIQKDVKIFAIDLKSEIVRAYYESGPNHYSVYVLTHQEPIWRNFAACKELFHVILDDPDIENCRTIDVFNHCQEITTKFPLAESKPDDSAISEVLAELAAMEFLFPFSERLMIYSSPDPLDSARISSRYSVPAALVEKYLAPDFMSVLLKYHERSE